MSNRYTKFFLFCLLIFIVTCGLCIQGIEAEDNNRKQIQKQKSVTSMQPIVRRAIKHDTSMPLRNVKPTPRIPGPPIAKKIEVPKRQVRPQPYITDQLLQLKPPTKQLPAPLLTFEGGSDDDNDSVVGFRVVPPDTQGDIGPNHYVQTINLITTIYDRNGNVVFGPVATNSFFQGFGGPCEQTNDGDPITNYDQLADRWVISQFAINNGIQCVAVSQTGDPTGSYHRYAFEVSNGFNDYPKVGVWPDAYYMTFNEFNPSYTNAVAVAMERDQMLVGGPADVVIFPVTSPAGVGCGGAGECYFSLQPSNLQGFILPPAGAPNTFVMSFDDEVWDTAPDPTDDEYKLWQFHVDWTNPLNSTFTGPVSIPTTEFDAELCGFGSCVPQRAPGELLDTLSQFTMFRLQYRNFTTHESLWVNHSVDVGGDRAGIRWTEIRNPASPSVFQSGTFAPNDGLHRWMGALAVDASGNMLVGYSVSSSTIEPEIRYAGRLSTDPPGQLTQGEAVMWDGTGVQSGSANRWGDYSSMSIDPVDDCTFWYTQEYYENDGSFDFKTRIGKLPSFGAGCSTTAGTLTGTVTDDSNVPLEGAKVQAGQVSTFTDANGDYTMILAAGTYDVTASKFGYIPETAPGVVVTEGQTTVQDFALGLAPSAVVSGTVTDGSGHGWPLYARINIDGAPIGPVFTNPATGGYSVQLPEGGSFTFNVNAISAGYNTESRPVVVQAGGNTENFELTVDAGTCVAPGYALVPSDVVLDENFESGFGNWTMTGLWNAEAETDACGSLVDPFPSPTHDAYYGVDGVCTFDNGDANSGSLTLVAPISIPGAGSATLVFSSYEQTECGGSSCPYDGRFVEISTNGGASWTLIGEGDTENEWYQQNISLAAYSGTSALIRFRFDTLDDVANGFFGWMVDNISVSTSICAPVPGGLLIGNVYDQNTGLGLNGAKVTSDNQPADNTTTFATPDDANVDEGFYILFSSLVGTQPFTASKTGYSPSTETPTIVADGVVEQDFNLGAGFIEVSPTFLEETVDIGTTKTVQLTLKNTGTGAANFELQEGNGLVSAPSKSRVQGQGAPLKRIKGRFTPWRNGFTAKGKFRSRPGDEGESEGMPVPKAPPWTAIADYPDSIMDNTAAEIDGLIYSVGGFDGGNILSSGFVYNPGTDSWSPIASMVGEREKPVVAAIDGKLYVTGGWDGIGSPDQTLEIYDPSSNTWSTGASIPVGLGGGGTAVNLDGKMYVIGGCSSNSCGFTDVSVYDPGSDSWSSAADYPEPTSWLACGAIGGQIYCAGGVSDALGESQNTYVYDSGSDSWSPLADMPQTQWAMGYIASDDLLYISGGVTDNFSTVTNEGFVYDPSTDSWSPLANSNNTLYRGGSACGFYKIGGSIGGFNPVPDSEVHPGLTNCGGAVDVPWLSENPVSGTILAGEQVVVDVTFDATVILQPGDFFANIKIKEDTPTSVAPVNVTMHVPLPPTWGTLEGTVNGLAQCDVGGGPLNKATVFVDTAGTDYTLQTDANGHYQVSFPAADSPVTITVSANKYVGQVRSGVVITAQQVTTENFTLRLDAPCITADPQSLEVTLDLGDSSTVQTTLINTGAGAANFELAEGNGHTAGPTKGRASRPRRAQQPGAQLNRIEGKFTPHSLVVNKKTGATPQGTLDTRPTIKAPPWVAIADYPGNIMDNTAAEVDGLIYSVGGFDGGNILNTGFVYDPSSDAWSPIASMVGEREKPVAAAIDGKLYVTGGWDGIGSPDQTLEIYDPSSNTWSAGASIPVGLGGGGTAVNLDGRLYVIGGCNSNSCGFTDVSVYDPGSDSWTSAADYPEPTSWLGCGVIGGQIFCAGGVSDANGESQHTYVYDSGADAWTQLADMPQTQWAMGYIASDDLLYISGGVTDNFSTVTNEGFVYDPSTDVWTPIANSNNTLYRGGSACGFYKIGGSIGGFTPVPDSEVYPGLVNCGGAGDVPWLSENPTTGTLGPDGGTAVIDVTFDAGVAEVTEPGDYLAHIRIKDDTPYNHPDIQATMHVLVPDMTIADTSNTEGNSGVKAFAVTVNLSKTPLTNVTVDYSTADGTAEAGVDYVSKSGTLTILAGQTSGTININVIGDLDSEANETFFVNLANAHGAAIADAQAQVTITNDDVTCPTITLNDTLPDGNVNKPYTGTVVASGGTGPYTYAVTDGSLPLGLTLNSNGTLSGTPTKGATYNFVITGTDSIGCKGSRIYTVVIKGKKK